MQVSIINGQSDITVSIAGPFTLYTLIRALPVFVDLTIQDSMDVILDLTDVTELDAAAAGMVSSLENRLHANGLSLFIAGPYGDALDPLVQQAERQSAFAEAEHARPRLQ